MDFSQILEDGGGVEDVKKTGASKRGNKGDDYDDFDD